MMRILRAQHGSIWRGLMDGAFAIAAIQIILHLNKAAPLPARAVESTDETLSTDTGDGMAPIALLEDALVFPDGAAVAQGDKLAFLALRQDDLDSVGWPAVSADGANGVDLMLRISESNFDVVLGFNDQQASILV
jgi:hypothetical protein